jgi:hypothetical protein
MRCGHCNVRVSCDPAQPAVYNTMWQVFAAPGRARRLLAPGAASGRLSTTQTQVMAAALCARVTRPLTEDEWRRFMPDGACFNPDAAAPLQALITARGPARGLARHHSAAPSDLRNRVVCTLSPGQGSSSNANAYPRGVQ